MCLARAIGVCFARVNKIDDKEEWEGVKKNSAYSNNLEILVKSRKTSKATYKNICSKKRNEQGTLAKMLCELADVATDRPGCLSDIEKFEKALEVRIAVISASLGNKFSRKPDKNHPERPILYLYMTDHEETSHFHSIVGLTGFFRSVYFCEDCCVPYNNKNKHKCNSSCLVCQHDKCYPTNEVPCPSCNMTCRSGECFSRHRQKKQQKNNKESYSPCERYWRCTLCKKVIDRIKSDHPHVCGEWFCESCQTWVKAGHLCFIFPDKNGNNKNGKIIFFDFEATQDSTAECSDGYTPDQNEKCLNCQNPWCGRQQHVPNFVLAQTACERCMDDPIDPKTKCHFCGNRCHRCDRVDMQTKLYAKEPCQDTCGFREVQFKGDNTVDQFGQWLFHPNNKNSTVLAHNMKGYDGIFLVDYLLSNSIKPNKILYNGTKIMFMEVEKGLNIKVLDSYNFLPMRLAKLPETFGFSELKKGYFPHFFNTKKNALYKGPYPDVSDYGEKFMSKQDREIFLEWHRKKIEENATFDMQNEMESYCRSDVDILRRACIKFRKLLKTTTGVNPFHYITIASVCMGVFKQLFLETHLQGSVKESTPVHMKCLRNDMQVFLDGSWKPLANSGLEIEKTKRISTAIGQVPSAGYVQKETFSKGSIEWLEWEMHRNQTDVQHALNGGEKKIEGTRYRVDGYCKQTNTVMEYLGCVWHGCCVCFPHDRRTKKHTRTNQSMDELYALAQIKKSKIKRLGYNYVYIWEHDWVDKKKKYSEIQSFVSSLDIQNRLDPRDSFYGGRTNACQLYYKTSLEEKIKYVDFTSLYPFVNKYCTYPVGHPEIITHNFTDVKDYFGIVKASIIPPRGLYHPVLPYRSNGKLTFPLCHACTINKSQDPCNHSDNQRALLGTWCTPEIHKALELGYKVMKIYEVYNFRETSRYDPQTGEGGLFAPYVNMFLKIKQEASDWPDWCKTESDKQKYVNDYAKHEGVKLDPNNIGKNPGLRTLAKLCLNSFWGKFAESLNRSKYSYFHHTEMDQFLQLVTDPSNRVKDFHIINKDNIQLEWEHQDGFVPESAKTNVFLATFTTCWARLELYNVLEKVGHRVLYYDTDSIIYVSKPDCYDPPLGDYLGQLTNELKDDSYITEFASGGPKNYTFTTSTGKQVCKIRGFSLNYENSSVKFQRCQGNGLRSSEEKESGSGSREDGKKTKNE